MMRFVRNVCVAALAALLAVSVLALGILPSLKLDTNINRQEAFTVPVVQVTGTSPTVSTVSSVSSPPALKPSVKSPPSDGSSAAAYSSSWNADTDLIIVSAHFNEDLTWLRAAPYPVVVCDKDGAAPTSLDTEPRCQLPNYGREAGSYLKFIIEFYDELPKRVAFLHGHENAWHVSRNTLKAIGCAREDADYVALNSHYTPKWNVYENDDLAWLYYYWDDYFKPYLNIDLPDELNHECCAQFIVTRSIIRRLPKYVYERWFDLLMNIAPDDYSMGMGFEVVWHIIFGEPPFLEDLPAYYLKSFKC